MTVEFPVIFKISREEAESRALKVTRQRNINEKTPKPRSKGTNMAPHTDTGFQQIGLGNGNEEEEIYNPITSDKTCGSQQESLLTLTDSPIINPEKSSLQWTDSVSGWDNFTDVCEWQGITCDDAELVRRIQLEEIAMHVELTEDIGCIHTLEHIHLKNNGLKGIIPTSIASLPSLQMIDLSMNSLTGEVPVFVSESLVEIVLGDNEFSGTLSKNLSDHPLLKWFDVSFNQLSGIIPNSISSLSMLEILEMSNNSLTGTLPESFANLKALEDLFIQNNQLTGTLPKELFNSQIALRRFWIQNNFFSGSLPQSMVDLIHLDNLDIAGNKLQGTIPFEVCERVMHSGPTPASRAYEENSKVDEQQVDPRCNNLACAVDTYSTSSSDNMGSENCVDCPQDTRAPFLGSAECHTTYQRQILLQFYQRNNGSTWNLDKPWSDDTNANECDWEGIACTSLGKVQKIQLSGRNIGGTIYEGLGYLLNLSTLDLSDNLLTGKIPVELALPPLSTFKISGNQIEGQIPTVLCQKSDINGNGDEGLFTCDRVACPEGTYSSSGHATGSNECDVCNDKDSIYLASSTCENPSKDYSFNLTDGFVIGTSAIVSLLAFGFVVWFVVKRLKKNEHGSFESYTGSSHISVTIGDEHHRKGEERIPLSLDDQSNAASNSSRKSDSSRNTRKEVWLDVPRI